MATTMNATSLYVTTNQIILKSQPEDASTWQDLYRLLPYLRNSLCCVVCGGLLVGPVSPAGGKCQHHLCQHCTGGKRKIKPACIWCKDCDTFNENKQLRTLLQCYKKMCIYLANSGIYIALTESATDSMDRGAANLIGLIKEGASFCDNYEGNIGLSKETYSILPCVFTNSATQTPAEKNIVTNSVKPTNGAPMYSVMFAGSGNKITIKRKQKPEERATIVKKEEKSVFKKPTKSVVKARRGCRCGNATATPGKLTCCGQRCPCYVDSKACIDCKCRGCRNPHTLDGNKVLNLPHHILQQYQEQNHTSQIYIEPHQAQLQEVDEQLQQAAELQQLHVQQLEQPVSSTMAGSQPLLQHVKIELDANLTFEQLNEHLSLKVFEPYSEVPPTLPHTFLMHTKREDLDDEEITVDV